MRQRQSQNSRGTIVALVLLAAGLFVIGAAVEQQPGYGTAVSMLLKTAAAGLLFWAAVIAFTSW